MKVPTKQVGRVASNLRNGPAPLDGTVDRKAVMAATAEECFAALCQRPALGDRTFTADEAHYELCERYVGHMQHYITCNGEEVPLQEIPIQHLQAWCIHAGRTPKHRETGFGFEQIKPALAATA